MAQTKTISDFPLLILQVSSQMVLTHSDGMGNEAPFQLQVEEVPCVLAANTYRLFDGKTVSKKDLMVARQRTIDSHPSYRVHCLPEDLEKAIALVVEKCREQCAKNGAAQRVMEVVFAKKPIVLRKSFRE